MPTRDRRIRAIVIALVAMHTLLVVAYTLPDRFVPEGLFVLAQRYARPMFHQRWELFAPDLPQCTCVVEVGIGSEAWRPLHASDANYLTRRMARTIAWYIQAERDQGGELPSPGMRSAIRSMVRDMGREATDLRFRLKETCPLDPERPSEREVRITPLDLARP